LESTSGFLVDAHDRRALDINAQENRAQNRRNPKNFMLGSLLALGSGKLTPPARGFGPDRFLSVMCQ
jgi:hypothetical protein